MMSVNGERQEFGVIYYFFPESEDNIAHMQLSSL